MTPGKTGGLSGLVLRTVGGLCLVMVVALFLAEPFGEGAVLATLSRHHGVTESAVLCVLLALVGAALSLRTSP